MDRRQPKTREAIFKAFNRLLKKSYNHITMQEIIEVPFTLSLSRFYKESVFLPQAFRYHLSIKYNIPTQKRRRISILKMSVIL